MDCTLIQTDLIGYHFATLGDDERRVIEEHLVACSGCLRTYLALKAHVDGAAHQGEGPSEAARLRLRAAVEARFKPTVARRWRRWLTRPVPLYQGVAVATLVVVATLALPTLMHALQGGGDTRSAERVDTARPTTRSLTIY
jgi:hypothetical protein